MLGKLLQGRYQIIQVLSAGGFCETYLAEDTCSPNHSTCVVKHLVPASNHPESLSTLRRLFAREAEALKKLGNYAKVPQLLDYFEDNSEFYLVQEYIVGHPLSQELQSGQRWSESAVVQLLQEVLGILEFIHDLGLIHRDIKPSNLIRQQQQGQLVLIDFGSVKQAWQQVVTAQGQTSTSFAVGIPATIAIGTPGYMPTEQSRGRPRPNSDIFALGMIGIQALTGLNPTQLLEDSDTGEIIWQHHAQVSAELVYVLNKMVRYHFQDRYQSAKEALQALQALAVLYPLPPEQKAILGQSSTQQQAAAQLLSNTLVSKQAQASAQESTPVFTGKRSALKLGDNTSGAAIPASKAQPSKPETMSVLTGKRPIPHLGNKTSDNAINSFLSKFAVLIGITTAVAAAIALMVGSYYFLRSPGVDLKTPNSPVSISTKNTSLENLTLANTLTGHSDSVWSVAISPTGQTLASGSGDNTIKLWNLATGQLNRTLTGHSDTVRSVTFSPDGQTLASGSGSNTIRLWNLQTGEQVGKLTGHSGPVWSVAISRDGKTLVSGSEDSTIKIWHLPSGELHRTLFGHSGRVFSVALSPDNQTLATAGIDKTIKIWNWQTGELLRTLEGHSDAVRSVVFSPDGQQLASGSWDKTIKIWNWQTGELLRTLEGHSDRVVTVISSVDGQTLASGSVDNTIKIWGWNSGELLRDLSGHSDWVLSVATSPVGQTLVSGSKDKTIKIWQ